MTLVNTPALLLILSTIWLINREPTISPTPRTLKARRLAISWSLESSSGIVRTIIMAARPDQYAIEMPVQNICGNSHRILLDVINWKVNLILPEKVSLSVSTISALFLETYDVDWRISSLTDLLDAFGVSLDVLFTSLKRGPAYDLVKRSIVSSLFLLLPKTPLYLVEWDGDN